MEGHKQSLGGARHGSPGPFVAMALQQLLLHLYVKQFFCELLAAIKNFGVESDLQKT